MRSIDRKLCSPRMTKLFFSDPKSKSIFWCNFQEQGPTARIDFSDIFPVLQVVLKARKGVYIVNYSRDRVAQSVERPLKVPRGGEILA